TKASTADTTWLTGLRGTAAFIVAFTHFFEGELNAGFRGYLADPPEINRYFFQLPLIRVAFAGQGMVALFFVISAYSISIKPLRLRDNFPKEEFLYYLSSSTFRRGFRLYTPAFAMEAMGHTAMVLGFYHWPQKYSNGLTGWNHIAFQASYMLQSLNPISSSKAEPLNGQLWTIPLEFFGSCIVFLTILCTSNLRTSMRPLLGALIGLLSFWNSSWVLFTYMCGLTICESRIILDRRNAFEPKDQKKSATLNASTLANWSMLLFSLYLLGLPERPESNPFSNEYLWLRNVTGSGFQIDDIAQLWRSFGGALCVFAISNSLTLQTPFKTAAAQYLGKISFGLYLVHILIYQMWRNPILDFFGWMTGPSSTIAQWVSWGGSGIVLAPVVFGAADLLTKTVDKSSIDFSRWIEKCLQ
ncbi:acyltransferase 3, partial [Pyrenochaeta sp. MPI-SDFR-AT-0127]